jgi:AraC-like DNA-binding protein
LPHQRSRKDFRISEIAYQVGFNDLSYFNRTFRRRFGPSPGAMRESVSPISPGADSLQLSRDIQRD